MLTGVEVIDLILHLRILTEGAEAMSESLGHIEHEKIVLTQLKSLPLPTGGRVAAQVDHHIPHTAPRHPHQFGLREGGALKMESAHDAADGGTGVVILHEGGGEPRIMEFFLGIAFHEESTLI